MSLPKIIGAVVAVATLLPAPTQAASLVNADFETGNLSGWNTAGDVTVIACTGTPPGCAPGGGTYFATLNNTAFNGNASLSQTVTGIDPGTYKFGAYISFATDNAAGNFDQGQISLTVQGPGTSATVGYDPNALNGQFTIPGGGGFSFTPWFLLSGILTYSGPGAAPFLLNINIQNQNAVGGLVLDVDNAFISAVPIPAALPLFAGGLGFLGWMSRRRRKNEAFA